MRQDKVMGLSEAVAEYVHDGDELCIEGFGHLIPFAAAHEIIRQGRRDLRLVRMTPDLVSDQLLGAGCIASLTCSFFASGSAGGLPELRRRIEQHDPEPLPVEEYSHHGMYCRYRAGAANLPFFPILSYAGSDLPELNPDIRTVPNPYGDGEEVFVVPAVNPDVALIHAQRADRYGNVQLWGITGFQQEAAYAAKRVVVTVEELVEPDVVRADPNRTLIPAHAVDAVVCVPRGAYPSYAQGYYDRDNAFYREWTGISQDKEGLRDWLDSWVRGTADHAEFLERIGRERLATVAVAPRPSGEIDYGRRIP